MGRPSWVQGIEDFFRPIGDVVKGIEFYYVLAIGVAMGLLLVLFTRLYNYCNPPDQEERAKTPRRSKRKAKTCYQRVFCCCAGGSSKKNMPGRLATDRSENLFATDSQRSLYGAELEVPEFEFNVEPGKEKDVRESAQKVSYIM